MKTSKYKECETWVKKISYNELKEIKKGLSFYDFDNLNSINGQIIVKFNDDFKVTRFDDIKFGGLNEDFELQSNMLKDLMMEFIKYYKFESIIIAKYQPKWIVNKDKSPELTEILRCKGLRTNFSGAISVKNIKVIEDFFYSNLKYNSFTQFILLEPKVIITPTDHLDVFIASSDINNTLDVVKRISEKIKSNKIVVEKLIVK